MSHERDRRNSSELGLPAALPNSLLPSSLHATRTLGSLAQFVRLENIAVRYTISPPRLHALFSRFAQTAATASRSSA
jgi:hypothetical protein